MAVLAVLILNVPLLEGQGTNPTAHVNVNVTGETIVFLNESEAEQVPFAVRFSFGNTVCAQRTMIPVALAFSEQPASTDLGTTGPEMFNFTVSVGVYGGDSYAEVQGGNITVSSADNIASNATVNVSLTARFEGGSVRNCTGTFPTAESTGAFTVLLMTLEDQNATPNSSTPRTFSPGSQLAEGQSVGPSIWALVMIPAALAVGIRISTSRRGREP